MYFIYEGIMESNVKALLCLFSWILNKGINNIEVKNKDVENEEFLKLKVSRNSIDLKYDPNITWGSVEEMYFTIHYALMLCSGYLIKKEKDGWVCFKLGNGLVENKRKYDLPSVQQCSCLRTAYNQGDCRHIKMLKGHLSIQERLTKDYKYMY